MIHTTASPYFALIKKRDWLMIILNILITTKVNTNSRISLVAKIRSALLLSEFNVNET